jgi:hypothetical protein
MSRDYLSREHSRPTRLLSGQEQLHPFRERAAGSLSQGLLHEDRTGEDKYQVSFDTGESAPSDIEVYLLDCFLASVVAARR